MKKRGREWGFLWGPKNVSSNALRSHSQITQCFLKILTSLAHQLTPTSSPHPSHSSPPQMDIPSIPSHRATADDVPPSAAAAQRVPSASIPYDVEQIHADIEKCSRLVWDVKGMKHSSTLPHEERYDRFSWMRYIYTSSKVCLSAFCKGDASTRYKCICSIFRRPLSYISQRICTRVTKANYDTHQ